MIQLLQVIFDGLGSGAGYVVIALGFSLIFGVAGVLNVAHADFYMVGAYASLVVLTSSGGNLLLGVLSAVIVGAGTGAFYYFVVVRRVAKQEQLAAFVASLGLSMFLQNGVARLAGPDPVPFPSLTPNITLNPFGLAIPLDQLALIGVALALSAVVIALLQLTPLGRNIRAVAGNPYVAGVVGVNVRATMLAAVILSCVVAAVGGLALGNTASSISPFMGTTLSVKMFIVVLVAGAGSLRGAVIVGFALGILESFTVAYLSSSYQDIVGLVALLIVLLIRPRGLFARAVRVG